jgi:hypothetical protein
MMLNVIVATAAMPPKATIPTISATPAKMLFNITLPPQLRPGDDATRK